MLVDPPLHSRYWGGVLSVRSFHTYYDHWLAHARLEESFWIILTDRCHYKWHTFHCGFRYGLFFQIQTRPVAYVLQWIFRANGHTHRLFDHIGGGCASRTLSHDKIVKCWYPWGRHSIGFRTSDGIADYCDIVFQWMARMFDRELGKRLRG